MVLWEIALGTAYFLGLKRTYRHTLRIQRKIITTPNNHSNIGQFVHGRTRAAFDMAVKVHQNIQERDVKLGRNVFQATKGKALGGAESALQKAEDVVTGMLAKGFTLGKDAVNKAKSFDEKHQLSSTASAKVTSFDQKLGLTEKISVGASVVSDRVREVDQKFQILEKSKSTFAVAEQKVSTAGSTIMKNHYVLTGASWVTGGASVVSDRIREVDQKFQVSEKSKSAFAAAEQKVSTAGSTIMKDRYVLTGASWVTGAFSKVAKTARDVGQKTREKVENAEEEQKR